MESNLYLVFICSGLLLCALEIFAPGFILFPIGLGSIVAGTASYFGLSTAFCIFLWSATSIFCWLSLKKFFTRNKASEMHSSSDTLVGLEAMVIEEINAATQTGRIKLYGDEWSVLPQEDQMINKGKKVIITENVGNKVKVKVN